MLKTPSLTWICATASGIALMIFIMVCQTSCGGNQISGSTSHDLAVESTGVAPAPAEWAETLPGNGLRVVSVQPQKPEISPAKNLSWQSPGMLRNLLPDPKSNSWTVVDLFKNAADFDVVLPNNNVDNSLPPSAVFSPTWIDAEDPGTDDLAYVMYNFSLADFDQQQNQTIHFLWSQPPVDYADFWVALGNVTQRNWDWYPGPDDGVLTIESYTPYMDLDGQVLVALALTGSDSAILDHIVIGDPEVRGTGEILDSLLPVDLPPIDTGGQLVPAFDLAAGCAPVRNQGTVASCVAFAFVDGALNYELGRLYGPLGWDFSDPYNLVSPRFQYVASGETQDLGSPWDGRYSQDSLDWLRVYGASTEQNTPYEPLIWLAGNGYAPADWSGDLWTPEALQDTQYLDIEGWDAIYCQTTEGLESIKAVIANQERVVVLRTNLDSEFNDYSTGEWDFTGPADGSHAMCITGYDDFRQAFKARNSWGDQWGDGGYLWISYETILNPEADVRCWYLWDDYNADAALRYCGQQADLAPPASLRASDGEHADVIALVWARSADATGYRVYRDRQDNLVATLGDKATWDDTQITDFNRHTYWLVAFNAEFESAYSTPDTGFIENDPIFPPINLTASDDNPSMVFIEWDHPVTGPIPVDGYKIFRDDIEIYSLAYPATVYADTDVVSDTTYVYKARSYRAGYLDSGFSNTASGRLAGDLDPPLNVAAGDGTAQDYVRVTWSHPVGGSIPEGYKIYRSTEEDGAYMPQADLGYVTQWDDSFATPRGTVYWYKIKSTRFGFDDSAYSLADSGYMPDNLDPPESLAAGDGTSPAHVRVTWSHPGSGPAPDGYKVFRSTSESGSYSELGTSTYPATSYDDTGATPGTDYWYKARSYKGTYSDSAFSGPDTGYRDYVDPPDSLAASDGTYTDRVEITWLHPSGGGQTPDGYDIYRSATENGIYTEVGSVGYVTTWDDTTATPRGTTYWYKARSYFSGYSDSAFSNQDSGYMVAEAWYLISVVSNNDIEYTDLLEIDSRPAICFYNADLTKLEYIIAGDYSGGSWSSRYEVDAGANDVGQYCSMATVDGNPAVAYYDATDLNLEFNRAGDATGTTWGIPVTAYDTDDVGSHCSLAVISGNPAISFSDATNSNLKYVYASNAFGSAWQAPVDADANSNGYQYTGLLEVSGNPAISYYDSTSGFLRFVRASDSTGGSWDLPQSVDSSADVGGYTSLVIVSANPAIAYMDWTNLKLKYVRATNAEGSVWGTPQTISDTTDCGNNASMGIWGGNPVIAYGRDDSGNKLGFVEAADSTGSTWGFPENVGSADLNANSSFAVVDGYPAISFISGGDLKYAVYY